MTRLLYTATIPENALQDDAGRTNAQPALSKLTGLDTSGTVASTGIGPNEVSLSGKYTGRFADLSTLELLELFASQNFDQLPFSDPQGDAPEDGYFAVERPDAGRVQPQSDAASTFSATLVREGTRRSHRRRLATDATQRTHEFGTDTTVTIGVPAAATDVNWLDTDETTRAAATPNSTVTAELGDVDLYDVTSAPTGDNPKLAYDLALDAAGDVDVAVYDSWNNPERTPDGTFAHQQVFTPQHEFRGDVIIENGRIQLRIDLSTDPQTLTVEEYSGGSWGATSLGTSDWRLSDIDVRSISAPDVRAFMEFEDTAGSDTHTLEAVCHRGWQSIQFLEPADSQGNLEQSSTAPQGLVDRLTPIAATTLTDPEVRQGLIRRDNIPL